MCFFSWNEEWLFFLNERECNKRKMFFLNFHGQPHRWKKLRTVWRIDPCFTVCLLHPCRILIVPCHMLCQWVLRTDTLRTTIGRRTHLYLIIG
jgi:hypothetical protein